MSEFKNIFIYVSDALRYDYIPDSIAEEGNVIPTLTPASYTPISFASMLTGLNPSNHNVRSFHDTIEKPTFFDLFENHCYYDHPDGAMCKNVFKNYTASKELEEMEEPFLYIERALDTHSPHGEVHHGNEIPENPDQSGSHQERYERGVESTEEHFWEHVEKLKELGIYEDTLIIFTSDHGELLGERILFRKRRGHNKPVCNLLNVAPTVFLNSNIGADRMRLIDVLPTALDLTEKDQLENIEGFSVEEKLPTTGESMIQLSLKPRLIAATNWKYTTTWTPTISKAKADIITLLADIILPLKRWLRGPNSSESSKESIISDVDV